MTDPTCPACDAPIEDYRWVGPVTVALDPCGHQIDDRLFEDLRLDDG